jgi:hypothetical protein
MRNMKNMNVGKVFTPLVGKCYDIRFGKLNLEGHDVYYSARIRVKGVLPSQWENIATGQTLDPRLALYAVQAHKEIMDL